LSIFRTPSHFRSTRFTIAVTAPVIAVVATLAGTMGAAPAGASARQATATTVTVSLPAPGQHSQAAPASARLLVSDTADRPAQLDAVLVASSKKAALTPKQIAWRLLGTFHWHRWQFRFLNRLWSRESSWNVRAENLYSGAYGIPQAVPGSKMSAAGPHWQTSARTQILWGLEYIKDRYGSPHAAWEHELGTGWY
jgi:hypothetical protein